MTCLWIQTCIYQQRILHTEEEHRLFEQPVLKSVVNDKVGGFLVA